MEITKNHINSILFGVSVADALGVPVEFSSRGRMEQYPISEMIDGGIHDQPIGTWSDDSSMTFLLAVSLLDDEFDLRKLANRFINWYEWGYWTPHGEVFDIGNTTSAAIARLRTIENVELAGGNHETENGNGSLMRILPLVLLAGKHSVSEYYDLVKSVSSLTHRHERSIVSCFYYLTLAKLLIKGNSKEAAYALANGIVQSELEKQSINKEEQRHFKRILEGEMRSIDYSKIRGSGYVVHSLEASVWCLLNTDSYEQAILKAIHLGEDTDTTAAITGGLAALHYGFESIPTRWLSKLVKREEIEALGSKLIKRYVL